MGRHYMCNECGRITFATRTWPGETLPSPRRACKCGSYRWVLIGRNEGESWAHAIAAAQHERAEWDGFWDRHCGMGRR